MIADKIRKVLRAVETKGTTGLAAVLIGGILASGALDASRIDTVAFSHYITQLIDSLAGLEQAIASIKFGQISLGAAASLLLWRHRAPSPPEE